MVDAPPRQAPTPVPGGFIRRIVETLHPEQIWLFGSRARGDHRPESDWDLLAVVPDTAREDDLDLVGVWARLRDLRLQRVDVFPVRRGDFEQARDVFGSLCQIVVSEGSLVYAR